MPKATLDTTEAPKRAPRRRVAKAKPAPEVEPKEEVKRVAAPRARRKAPTRLESPVEVETVVTTTAVLETHSERKSLYIKSGLLVTSFVAAAIIGYSDQGQINTASLIGERNAEIASGNAAAQAEGGEAGGSAPVTAMIPVQNTTSALPDGGLKSSGALPPPPPEPVASEMIASSTASSTEEVASTTESVTATSTSAQPEDSAPTEVAP